MIEDINYQWQLDENGSLTYQKVVDFPDLNKTELYNRAMDYFVSNYDDVNSVILDRDTVNGIIAGKGIFQKVQIQQDVLQSVTVDTLHTLKVEVRDGKARITVSLTNYDEIVKGGELPGNHYLYQIQSQYPFNASGYQKELYEQAFKNSHLKVLETIASLERALRGEVAYKKEENW